MNAEEKEAGEQKKARACVLSGQKGIRNAR